VVAAGYRGLYSPNAVWYLDHLQLTWTDFYTAEPLAGISDPTQQQLVRDGARASVRLNNKGVWVGAGR
jgi:hexosaminidase